MHTPGKKTERFGTSENDLEKNREESLATELSASNFPSKTAGSGREKKGNTNWEILQSSEAEKSEKRCI